MYVCALCTCMSVHHVHTWSHRGQERPLNPLRLELQVMSCHMCCESDPGNILRKSKQPVLLATEASLQPLLVAAVCPRLFWNSCLSLLNAEMISVCDRSWLFVEPGTLRVSQLL